MESILVERLEKLVGQWKDEFMASGNGELIKGTTIMQVKIVNNTITLEPSLAEARCFWYNSLHSQVDMICSLNRIKGSRYYDQIKDTGRKTVKDYHSVLTLMNQDILDGSYLTLEGQMDLVTEYTNTWK